MKIIKIGSLPEKRTYFGTCIYCKTVMEAEQDELQWRSDHRNGGHWQQKCLLCDNETLFRLKPPENTND